MSQLATASTKNTSKKDKALLAGGLVLGIGAAVTLASWTDEEWASASFNSGAFTLESSIDGNHFNKAGDGQQLKFDLPTNNLAPGDTVAAPLALRLDGDTSYAAQVNSEGPRADAMGLKYDLRSVDSFEACQAGSTAGSPITAIGLTPGKDNTAGQAQILCFHVTATDALKQGQTTDATWTFTATSADN